MFPASTSIWFSGGERRRRNGGFGGEPCRLHRRRRPEAGRRWKAGAWACFPAAIAGWTRPSSSRPTVCASRSWKTRRRPCRSATSMSTCRCQRPSPQGSGLVREDLRRKAGHAQQQPVVDLPGVPDPLRHGRCEAGADAWAGARPHRLRRQGPRRLRAASSKPTDQAGRAAAHSGGGNTITYITDPGARDRDRPARATGTAGAVVPRREPEQNREGRESGRAKTAQGRRGPSAP